MNRGRCTGTISYFVYLLPGKKKHLRITSGSGRTALWRRCASDVQVSYGTQAVKSDEGNLSPGPIYPSPSRGG